MWQFRSAFLFRKAWKECFSFYEKHKRDVFTFFLLLQKEPKSSYSDASKVAGGKFWRVGDRRNREYCERTRTRRPCFKETIAKYLDFDLGRLVLGLAAASGRLKGRLHVIFGAAEKENWCVPTESLAQNTVYLCMGNLEFCHS